MNYIETLKTVVAIAFIGFIIYITVGAIYISCTSKREVEVVVFDEDTRKMLATNKCITQGIDGKYYLAYLPYEIHDGVYMFRCGNGNYVYVNAGKIELVERIIRR